MGLYLNSAETRAQDGDVILADDFEDGVWYETHSDNTGSPPVSGNGEAYVPNDGWKGNIYTGQPANAVAGGAVGTAFTASTGNRSTGGKAAWHYLGPTFPPSARTTYEEIYHRFYIKFSAGYDFGHEKLIAYQETTSISDQIGFLHSPWGGKDFNFYANERESSSQGPSAWLIQNQGNDLSWVRNTWYYVEVRIKLDTVYNSSRDGIIQIWADSVGTDGLGNAGAGTLRLSYTDVPLRRSAALKIGIIHHEFWLPTSPPEYTGSGEVQHDQLIVSTARVSPMGYVATDITAPILSEALAGSPTPDGTANPNVRTNEANGTLYWATYDDGSATPSKANIKAATGTGVRSEAGSKGSVAITAAGIITTTNITGLTAETAYDTYWMHEDAAGNQSAVLIVEYTTIASPDVVAPVLSAGDAGVITSDGCTGASITTDEDNGTMYWAVSATPFAASDAQVIAGTGGNIVASGNAAITVTGSQAIPTSVTGRAANTAHRLHWVQQDAAANDSNQVTADFTTLAAPDSTAPILSAASFGVATGDGCSGPNVTTDEDNGTLYYAVSLAASSPTAAQVVAASGGGVLFGSSLALPSGWAVGQIDYPNMVHSLNPGTAYKIWYVQDDAASNRSNLVSSEWTTGASEITASTRGTPVNFGGSQVIVVL